MSDTYDPTDWEPVSSGGGITISVPSSALVNPQTSVPNTVQQLTHPTSLAPPPQQRSMLDKLLGIGGPRYQTWPERLVRSAATLPGEVYKTGQVPVTDAYGRVIATQPEMNPQTGYPSEAALSRVQDLTALAGLGSMPSAALSDEIGTLGMAGGKMVQPEATTPVFHSAVEQALRSAPQDKMTASQWQGWLKNQPGVKQEELDWLNLPKAGAPTKAQMLEHVQGHGPQIKEIEKTGPQYSESNIQGEIESQFSSWAYNFAEENDRGPTDQEAEEAYNQIDEDVRQNPNDYDLRDYEQGGGPKYSEFQLPGGENYRELLLTMPTEKGGVPSVVEKHGRFGLHWPNGERVLDSRGNAPDWYTRADAEQAARSYGRHDQGGYVSSHWDEPNVLVHMRMNDREIPDVGKSLHLEEVQSDWHQEGRKKGYRGQQLANSAAQYEQQLKDLGYEFGSGRQLYKDGVHVKEQDAPLAVRELFNKIKDASNQDYYANTRVPDAPFKTTWADLALKRAIAKAAREGYDAISWTPGEQQAERYDLSKHAKEVGIAKNLSGDGYDISFTPKNSTNPTTLQRNVPANKVSDYIGKDLAEKLIKQSEAKPDGWAIASGLDLKIGGEGMKKFYDKMLADKANAIGKKFGAKVEYKEIPDPDFKGYTHDLIPKLRAQGLNMDEETWKQLTPEQRVTLMKNAGYKTSIRVPVLRLTPKLKAAATGKGFPLFSSAHPGLMFTPVERDKDFLRAYQKGNAT